MYPINIANNVAARFHRATTKKLLLLTDSNGAYYGVDGKPIYNVIEDELTGDKSKVPAPFNIDDTNFATFAKFDRAVAWSKRNRLRDSKIVKLEVTVYAQDGAAVPIPAHGMKFRSTPEMWERRGVPGVTKANIVRGGRKIGHTLRMERQELAAFKRREGDFTSFSQPHLYNNETNS